jgi:hypothetical protein
MIKGDNSPTEISMQRNGYLFKKTVNRTREGSRYLKPSNVALPDSVDKHDKGR